MKNNTPLIVLVILIVLLIIGGLWLANRRDGDVAGVSTFDECADAGYPILESFPRQCKTPDGRTFTESVQNNNGDNNNNNDNNNGDTNDDEEDKGNASEVSDLIRVTEPDPNDVVTSPLTVTGSARGNWYFEATFPMKLIDASGKTLVQGFATAKGDWMTTEFVPFEGKLTFAQPTTATGTPIINNANASGLPQNSKELRIPVRFRQTMTIKAYFLTNAAAQTDCTAVTAVNRTITATQAVGRAAILELLKGPTTAEKNQGFTSPIPAGTQLNSLTISNGTARADFNDKLDQGVSGSCNVQAIRAEITQTLKQFPTVQNVIISINGGTADILQP